MCPSSSNISINSVSTENNVDMRCSLCNISVKKKFFASHLKSNIHKKNALTKDANLTNVFLIETAFANRIMTYRITSNSNTLHHNFETAELFLDSIKTTVFQLINQCISEHIIVKINFLLNANFIQQTKELYNSFDFQSKNYTFCQGDDLNIIYKSLTTEISSKLNSFEKKDSGWSLVKLNYIDMNVNKFNPLRGSSYIDLPEDIKSKKAIINVQNSDYQCFLWSILAGLHPVRKNANRVSSYIAHKSTVKFDNIPFPVKLKDVSKFENINNISINVFGLEYDSKNKINQIVGPLYFTKCKKPVHLNLLYITQGSSGHYCYIKNLSRLVDKQLSKSKDKLFICDGCLLFFSSQEKLINHQEYDCNHICVQLPTDKPTIRNWFNDSIPNNFISFNNYERKLKVPFVVYADFEAFLNPIQTCTLNSAQSFTNNVQKHEVYSFGFYIKCSYEDRLSKYRTYTGKNCGEMFLQYLKNDIAIICRENTFVKAPLPLTSKDHLFINNSIECYICNRNLSESETTLSYDKYTGCFLGVSHTICENKYHMPNFIPIFFHNLSNYDAHFIVQGLNFEKGEIEIIPQNKEKYISLTKEININNHKIKLRFLDSLKFMSSSLEKLASNLKSEQFCELRMNFPRDDDFNLLIRKGVYPYEYMTSFECLKITSLPTRDKFFNSLMDKDITENDFNHANAVWNHFNCKNMGDYSDLYLKTDVLLLADVFENFRNVCLNTYKLDPAHYYTAPGLSWDAMLIYTNIRLELLIDFEMVAFVKKGIRGGISQCSNRYAKANNKFMSDYNPMEPSSFLTYLDANNLYGWAMSQPLPTGGFEWVKVDTDFNIPNDADYGFILEVDLEYPDNLHDSHSDLPLCPELTCFDDSNENKLITNLHNKIRYVIHSRNLKQCLEKGLRLIKIHKILKFKQSPWLKSYIDLNTHLRTMSSTDFEKDFFKLMNNAVFGKTMENVEKRVNVKLLSHWENQGKKQGVQSLIARPEYHSLSIFSENLVAVQLNKTKIFYNKPIYLGFCILDISKTLMYQFHYDYMKPKYQENIKLLYTDTDSLVYQIFTQNFYDDIKPDLNSYFDTSDYPPDNDYGFPLLNKKRLAFFKDENNGKIFKEFVGLRAKMYAMDIQDQFIAKAKGVNKCVSNKFNIDDYKECLFKKNVKFCEMLRFKSIKHTIYTQKINKVSLSNNDNKRYLKTGSTDTLAWGHYSLRNMQS